MFFDATELQEVLGTIVCPHMKRAYRNRKRSDWASAAFKLTGDHDNAGAIYAACGKFCKSLPEVFDGSAMTPGNWQALAAKLPGFIADPPELALSRHQYELRHPELPSWAYFNRKPEDYPAGHPSRTVPA